MKRQIALAKFVASLIPAVTSVIQASASVQHSADALVVDLANFGDFTAPEAGVSCEAGIANGDRERLVRALRNLATDAANLANDLDTVEIVGK